MSRRINTKMPLAFTTVMPRYPATQNTAEERHLNRDVRKGEAVYRQNDVRTGQQDAGGGKGRNQRRRHSNADNCCADPRGHHRDGTRCTARQCNHQVEQILDWYARDLAGQRHITMDDADERTHRQNRATTPNERNQSGSSRDLSPSFNPSATPEIGPSSIATTMAPITTAALSANNP